MRYIPLLWLSPVACLAVALCVAPAAGPCAAGEPTPAQEIDALIAQLGSDSFEAREAAARRLAERDDAIPALRRARKSPDPEVARRAEDILDALARREQKRALAAFAELAKGGAVDRAVEKFVRRDRWDDEAACWKVLADLGDKLADLERRAYGKARRRQPDTRLKQNPANLPLMAQLTGLPLDGAGRGALQLWEEGNRWVLRAEQIQNGKTIDDFLIALSGGASIRGVFSGCAIFSCGSITCSGIDDSLVVCDGDFTVQENIGHSLIIARGTISCGAIVLSSHLISCGEVRLKYPKQVFGGSKIVEKEPKPLGFVKFFDPADVGITVEPADGGARVKSAEKGKPFAAAGVRADDLITAVNGQAVKDAESFRRLLRASLAVDGETVLKLRRDKQVSEVRIPAPGS